MPAPPLPAPLEITLSRPDFMLYTWVQALERPVLLFLMYSFCFLALLGVTGLWPAARVFSLALLLPLLLYLIWVYTAARRLWGRYPELRAPRRYTFAEDGYTLETAQTRTFVPYGEVALRSSRRALYLVRRSGGADLLPREHLPEGVEAFLEAKLGAARGSSFL